MDRYHSRAPFKGWKMRKIRSYWVFNQFETNLLLTQKKNQTQKVIKIYKTPRKKIMRANWRNC